ncbi:acetylcholine receptor subunit alpha-like [Ruditapes philippinarum]|uniref:acetylcholine receptor subunit alpha-like n=1 Tax=Ruditapes philippinarum TaxID=129788 RepID=UPI00295ABDB7|nr:acetylcholine receptor subunit alpha-like [Ruditapes philippinarum]
MEKCGIILLLMTMSALHPATCYLHSDMTRLIEDLFNDTRYSRLIRPIYNQDKVMEVNITPGIMTIESLDLTTSELLTIMYIQISWIDEFLMWNPFDYGGITKLPVPYEKLWIPPLSQSNGAMKEKSGQIINPGFAPVFVLPNGYVLLVTTGYYVTNCEINTSLYPFDSHKCTFYFFSALNDATEMELNSLTSDFALGLLQQNDAWRHTKTDFKKDTFSAENIAYNIARLQFTITLKRRPIFEIINVFLPILLLTVLNLAAYFVPVNSGENVAYTLGRLQFTITLKRRPIFEIINVFLPILLLTVLNLAANFVPVNSGERLSFSITLYLSFVFITSAMVNEMPHVAKNIAFSSYIMLSLNVLNTASVLWSVFMVRMATWANQTTPVPISLQKVVKLVHKIGSTTSTKVHPKINTTDDDSDAISTDKGLENSDIYDEGIVEKESILWSDAVKVFDKIYFTVTTVLVTCVISVMICLWHLSE